MEHVSLLWSRAGLPPGSLPEGLGSSVQGVQSQQLRDWGHASLIRAAGG